MFWCVIFLNFLIDFIFCYSFDYNLGYVSWVGDDCFGSFFDGFVCLFLWDVFFCDGFVCGFFYEVEDFV